MSDVNILIAKAISEIAKQNANIHKAIIESRKQDWLDKLLPLVFSLVISLITLFVGFRVQSFFFRRSETKDLKKDISKLYSEFAFFSQEYFFQFGTFSSKQLKLGINEKLIHAYLKIRHNSADPLPDLKQKIDFIQNDMDFILKTHDRDFKIFKDAKFQTIKALSEIQFHLNTPEFDKLVNKYFEVQVYTLENHFTIEELEKTNMNIQLDDEKNEPRLNDLGRLRAEILLYIRNESSKTT